MGVAVTALEAALEPMRLLAITEHEYCVPLLSPVTVSGLVAPVAVRLAVPALQVAV